MYLCLDVGNTTICIAVCENQAILKQYKLDTDYLQSNKYYEDYFLTNIGKISIEGIIISSVVPSINSRLENNLSKIYHTKIIFVHNELSHNVNIKIENPDELGSDLLISSIAACKKYSGNKIIVDLGTANKILVLQGNDFLGGAIAPGFKSSMMSLFKDAEKLSQVPIETPNNIIGNSTLTCIQSGMIYGTTSMIEGMISKIKEQIGDCKVLLTGGNATYIKDDLNIEFDYCPNLLIEGLIELYANNK